MSACKASSSWQLLVVPGMQRLIEHCSLAGGRALAAGLGVCRRGDHLLAELQAADCLLGHLLLVGDARLHAEGESTDRNSAGEASARVATSLLQCVQVF